MSRGRPGTALLLGTVVALAAATAAGQTAVTPTPAPAAATPAGTPAPSGEAEPALCGDCHEEAKTFDHNPHALWRPKRPVSASPNAVCESCHGDGTAHIESGGDKSLIRGFHGRAGAEFCTTCHTDAKPHASFKTGVHAPSETVNCLTCHSIHKSDPKSFRLLARPVNALCASCHPSQDASLRQKPFTHRIDRGGLSCVSCHEPHGRRGRESLRLTRVGELPCVTCHAEKRGPFVFEHPAGVVSRDCQTCHEPHGSSNPKQLVRARLDRLCLECHSTLAANTLGSQPPSFHNISLPRFQNCTTCHVAIHGSNLSPQLLK
jgi:DmsE family decaheme c-type cytochrome